MEKIEARDVNFHYGNFHALKGISMEIPRNKVVAFIGPSGCGKSTFLRLFNRMNDLIPGARLDGEILIDGKNIYAPGVQVDELRKEVGMVFQRPNPFPKSIFDNVAYGLRVNGIRDKSFITHRVEEALRGAALWEEVKDKLNDSAFALSGGQQQRLCIARAMAVSPSVLLMDEPASALDPISTAKVEELICELRKEVTIVIVTHNMQQASRVSDKTAFFYMGEMVEYDDTKVIFTNPHKEATQQDKTTTAMVKFIETELEDLGREVDQMWTLVYNQMEQAQQAVLDMDRGAAQQIMVRERRVDAFELKIDSDVEDFIALYTPVAVDLRYVLSMLKINNDLERIGDYADGIARFVRDCDAQSLDPELVEKLQLRTMFSTVLEMLKELQEALREENAAKATAVADKDDLLDRINLASTGILTDYAIAHKEAIPLCIGFGSVFRKLERTGDHLTNIAEEIVFYIDAKVLKHHGEDGKV